MTTLKDVQKDPKKLEQFIKEREQDTPQADKAKLDKIVKSMTEGKPSKGQ
jgi:flagellar motility protein MotE (MotC chaperone)